MIRFTCFINLTYLIMTTTTNADDLLIVSDEVKSENNDFLFFDTPSETKEEAIISFDLPEIEAKENTAVDFDFSFDTPSEEVKEEISFEEPLSESIDFFSTNEEKDENITETTVLETSENNDFSFGFDSIEKEDKTEILETSVIEEKMDFEIQELESKNEDIFNVETLSPEVSEKMTSVVWDLNSILDETISKLELRKTNLFALKDNKSTNIDDLNRQIAELKAKVKELESEVKNLETEDEQIEANITALQAMKLGEAVNNKESKKTTKKVA